MAADYSLEAEPETLERPILAESFESILGASGGETAGGLLVRRDAFLVETDKQNERSCSNPAQNAKETAPLRVVTLTVLLRAVH